MPGPAIDLFSSCATVLHAGRVKASVVFLSIFLLYHTNFDIRNSAIPGFTVSHTRYTKLVIILARTLLERICVNYGGILVNSISRFHAQFRSFAYYVRNFADAIFDAVCA